MRLRLHAVASGRHSGRRVNPIGKASPPTVPLGARFDLPTKVVRCPRLRRPSAAIAGERPMAGSDEGSEGRRLGNRPSNV